MSTIETFRGDFTTIDLDVTKDNHVVDLSGTVVYFIVKKHYGDVDIDALINKNSSSSPDIQILDVLQGKIRILIQPSDTSGLPNGQNNLVYSVRTKDSAAKVSTITEGILEVLPSINQTAL